MKKRMVTKQDWRRKGRGGEGKEGGRGKEREGGSRSQLQSPSAISEGCFRELYLAGTSG